MKYYRTVHFLLLITASWFSTVHADFGVSNSGGDYAVDTGAGLIFKVDPSNGNLTSLLYNGVEYQDLDYQPSHLKSGLGSDTTVMATNIANQYIKVTIQTSPTNTVASSLTHYLIARNGENSIYMATYLTTPVSAELRWITRLESAYLPNGPISSDRRGHIGTIESADVQGMPDGTTRSKYYGDAATHSKDRAMDMTYIGATGPNAGVWIVYGPRESSNGGPFFRDIQSEHGGEHNIYNYYYSGHNQTDTDWRSNVLHGPFALVFNSGNEPAYPFDFSWMGDLGLTGWIPDSGRGAVAGTVSGIPDGFAAVVGFEGTSAQYWAVAEADGSYLCPQMKPDTYDVTLYKQELEVDTGSVTVSAGSTNTIHLTASADPDVLWRLGDRDGTPTGFLNADKIIAMHPSDIRMADWTPAPAESPFVIGSDTPGARIPCYQWMDTGSIYIQFDLTPAQVVSSTVRIGITAAYSGARPRVRINGYDNYPGPSTQPTSRSLTIGTYRGNNVQWSYGLNAGNLVAGVNTLRIDPISGSGLTGFLSAGYGLDFIELSGPPPELPAAPTGLTAKGLHETVELQWLPEPSASHYILERAAAIEGPYSVLRSNWGPARYTDAAVNTSTPYFYRVTAVNAAGTGTASSPITAMPGLTAPENLTVSAAADDKIKLNWKGVVGADSYNVRRATFSGGPYTTIATGPTDTSYYGTSSYTDTGLTSGTTYYYVVSARNAFGESPRSTGAAATPAAVSQSAGSHGVICVEAEHYTTHEIRNGFAWTPWSGGGFSGGQVMQALPNDSTGYNTGYTTASPQLDFEINFNQTGTHYVWIRGMGPDGGSDSVHVGLDGGAVDTSDRMGDLNGLNWLNNTMDNTPATIEITSTGRHTINLWMRESGVMVDKLLLTTSTNFSPVGYGPAETRGPQPPGTPTGLNALGDGGFIHLNWNNNSETNRTGYTVYRSTTRGGPYTSLASSVVSNAYSDANISEGRTYYYAVTVTDDTPTESGISTEVSATTSYTPPDTSAPIRVANSVNGITLSATANSSGVLLSTAPFDLNGGNAVALLLTAEGLANVSSVLRATFAGQPMSTLTAVDTGLGAQSATIFYLIDPATPRGPFEILTDATVSADIAYSQIALFNVLDVADAELVGSTSSANTTPLNVQYSISTKKGFVLGAAANNDYDNSKQLSIATGNPDTDLLSHTRINSSGHFHTYGAMTNSGSYTDGYFGQFQRTAIATVAFDALPAAPPQLGVSTSGQTLILDWPVDYLGWQLQYQTNLISTNEWNPLPGTDLTNAFQIGTDSNATLFFRLHYP